MNYKWVRPKKPTYNKGVLVIDSDDGNIGDYSAWLPLFKRVASKYSDWANTNCVVGVSAINTADIGDSDKMTVEHLQELVDNHWELVSHGRYHTGLGKMEVVSDVSANSTTITIRGAGQIRVEAGYTYNITEGTTTEVIKPISPTTTSNTFSEVEMTLESPLQNTYTTNATIELTDSSLNTLLQGCIDDLNNWGFDCYHHVFTYHAGSQHQFSQRSVDAVSNLFVSGRGKSGATNEVGTVDLSNLRCQLNNITDSEVDTILDDVALNDKLFIYYGHGETSQSVLDKLEHLIEGALSRGIRIMTRTGALKHYGLM